MNSIELLCRVIIVGCAGWRLAAMLSYEAGPFDLFERLRRAVGVPDGPAEIAGFLPLLITCIWCTSVWTGTVMWLAWYVNPAIPALIASWSVAIAVERWNRR